MLHPWVLSSEPSPFPIDFHSWTPVGDYKEQKNPLTPPQSLYPLRKNHHSLTQTLPSKSKRNKTTPLIFCISSWHVLPSLEYLLHHLPPQPLSNQSSLFHPNLPFIPPPPIVPPTTITTTTEPIELCISIPEPYDGSFEISKQWLNAVQLYLPVNAEVYNNNNKKIAFILSYMTKGSALTWAATFHENAVDATGTIILGIYLDFVTKFNKAFKQRDVTGTTIAWLTIKWMVLKKDWTYSPPLNQYISEFQNHITQANIKDSNVLIRYVSAGIPLLPHVMHHVHGHHIHHHPRMVFQSHLFPNSIGLSWGNFQKESIVATLIPTL